MEKLRLPLKSTGKHCLIREENAPRSSGIVVADRPKLDVMRTVVSRRGCNTSEIMEVVLATRRVKQGPGRRPLSAKRQKFMELRERERSVRAAAREVGVSRSSGNNWASG